VTILNDQLSRSSKKGTVSLFRPEESKLSPFYSRRYFLQGTLLGMASLTLPGIATAMAARPTSIVPLVSKAELAAQLRAEFNLPDTAIHPILAKAVFTPSVIERMQRPYEARPYAQYRPLFVNKRLSDLGENYISKHKDIFVETRKQYGVQPEIIAAILGMETHYGRSSGRDRVLDALYTLSTGYPKRADFFRKELGNFILLCQEENLQPDKVIGSYAGAFGTTQFIPSSYRAYAVDADGDGKRDVWNSTTDTINSVGNYFHLHGWDANRPVAQWMPRLPQTTSLEYLRKSGMHDWKELKDIRKDLPALPSDWKDDDRVSLIEMDTKTGRRTALIHYNFYVITRWNRSYNYAMAVTELAGMLGCKLCKPGV